MTGPSPTVLSRSRSDSAFLGEKKSTRFSFLDQSPTWKQRPATAGANDRRSSTGITKAANFATHPISADLFVNSEDAGTLIEGNFNNGRRSLIQRRTIQGFDLKKGSEHDKQHRLPYSPRSYDEVKQTLHRRQTEVFDALETIANQRAEEREKMKKEQEHEEKLRKDHEEAKKASGKGNLGASEGLNMGDTVTIRGRVLNWENLDECSDANCRVKARIALHKLQSSGEGRQEVPMVNGLVDVAKLASGNWKKEDVEQFVRGQRAMMARPKSAPNFLARNRATQNLHFNRATQIAMSSSLRNVRASAISSMRFEQMEALRARAFAATSAYKESNHAQQQGLSWVKLLVICSFCEMLYGPVFEERIMRRRMAIAQKFHFAMRVLRFIRNCKRRVKTSRNWDIICNVVKIFRLVFRKKTRHRLIGILKDFLGRLGDAFKIQYGVRQYIWATRTVQRRWRAFSLWLKTYCNGELMDAFRLVEGQLLGNLLGHAIEDDVIIIDRSKIKVPPQSKKKSSPGRESKATGSHSTGSPSLRPRTTSASSDISKNSDTLADFKSRASVALEKALAEPAKKGSARKQQGRPSSATPASKVKRVVGNRPASASGPQGQGSKAVPNDMSAKEGGSLIKMVSSQASQARIDHHRFKRKWVYLMLRREVIEKLHTYCSTLVRLREAVVGEMELAKDWMQFRDYMQGDKPGHRSTAKVRIQEEAKQLRKEFQAQKSSKKESNEAAIWTFSKKTMQELVLAAHGSMGTRPKSQARFDELFGSCPPFMLDSLPRKLAGDQTIRVSMMLRQEYRLHPEGKVIESRYGGMKMAQNQETSGATKLATYDVVKKMLKHRDVEDTFFAAEVFSRDLGHEDGEQSELVCGRLRRHRNMNLCQAPITNIDGLSDSSDDARD
eukprot:gnl/MRDRNA2_/MRDRNA2_97960_c0_seq1.p1 gnl/MRDRNA2_/MRDRNA2_97960_c0~~gnl/MRDRNA2_/MRDRNA2_97960_c0_seq1.p1  ORF type:complete len:896 (-),score=161.07 gnl/MRDRNA2_/MRDRNA2_97960_c0_seq1:25-2712(-)